MTTKKLDTVLRAIFSHAAPIEGEFIRLPWRYAPRSINGGTGWHIWDRKTGEFITSKKKLLAIDPEELLSQ